MSTRNSLRSKIQAFEGQADVSEPVKPQPAARKHRPPVAAKPSATAKPQFNAEDHYENVPSAAPAPAPKPPKKPQDIPISVKQELNTLLAQRRSKPQDGVADEGFARTPPTPPVKPVKEPLQPSLNTNNHNNCTEEPLYDHVESVADAVRPKPSPTTHDCRPSVTTRPTAITVPSNTASECFRDSAPPLPVQRAVGALKAPKPSFPPQASHSPAPEPSLPPRRLTSGKSLPPRPPPAGSSPGRPPPPCTGTAGRSESTPWDPPPKPQAQIPPRKDPVLPPRPNPGHRLYNKYTLQVPHALASSDYNGSNNGELSFQKNEVLVLLKPIDSDTYECQVGGRRGRVHRSSMKVVTPLDTASDVPTTEGGTLMASGLTVEALHDFNPENPGELALTAGDVVTLVEQVDSEWYRGTCRGSSGFFPINYVKVLAKSPKPPDRTGKRPSAAAGGPRCVARFDFEGEHSDELSFCEGDVIQLRAYVGQDWARGQLGPSAGIFPLNYVEVIQDLPPAPSQQQTETALPGISKPSLAQGNPQVQAGSEWAVALYHFAGKGEGDLSFEEGDHIFITRHIDEEWSSGRVDGREGIFPRAFVTSRTAGKTSTGDQNGSGGVRAKALYDFESDCDEELSVKVGDIITNVESVDGEWFLGDLRGKRAMIPKNYVEIM